MFDLNVEKPVFIPETSEFFILSGGFEGDGLSFFGFVELPVVMVFVVGVLGVIMLLWMLILVVIDSLFVVSSIAVAVLILLAFSAFSVLVFPVLLVLSVLSSLLVLTLLSIVVSPLSAARILLLIVGPALALLLLITIPLLRVSLVALLRVSLGVSLSIALLRVWLLWVMCIILLWVLSRGVGNWLSVGIVLHGGELLLLQSLNSFLLFLQIDFSIVAIVLVEIIVSFLNFGRDVLALDVSVVELQEDGFECLARVLVIVVGGIRDVGQIGECHIVFHKSIDDFVALLDLLMRETVQVVIEVTHFFNKLNNTQKTFIIA